MYLENIDSPADVKKLSFNELNDLSNEIRASLLQKLSIREIFLRKGEAIVEMNLKALAAGKEIAEKLM